MVYYKIYNEGLITTWVIMAMYSRKPRIAGIWLIVTGSLAVVFMLLASFVIWTFSEGLASGFGEPQNIPLSIIWVVGLIGAIPGIIAIAAGFFSIKRRRWGFSLAGSICVTVYFNFLGIPALILLILSKPEFGLNTRESN
jgi:hypothetical protein